MPKTPNEIFLDRMKHVIATEKKLDERVRKHQNALFVLIAEVFLPKFKTDKDGVILDNTFNASLINEIDDIFDKLEKSMHTDVLAFFVSRLMRSTVLSSEYYRGLGFKKAVVEEIRTNKLNVEKKLGITKTGRLSKKGYLYKLGRSEEVRQRLKTYVLSSLSSEVSFLDFQLGFRNLVKGNRRVKGLATTGVLQRYFDQYAYDTFNQLAASTDKQFATSLNLRHFIYEGSLIKTSRDFCRKRAGKAFTVEETKTWKDDPDLIDKKTKSSYNPLIDRGRYRCRHFIKYITEELYNKLTS